MNLYTFTFKCILVNISGAPQNYNLEIKKQVNCLETQQSWSELRGFTSNGIN